MADEGWASKAFEFIKNQLFRHYIGNLSDEILSFFFGALTVLAGVTYSNPKFKIALKDFVTSQRPEMTIELTSTYELVFASILIVFCSMSIYMFIWVMRFTYILPTLLGYILIPIARFCVRRFTRYSLLKVPPTQLDSFIEKFDNGIAKLTTERNEPNVQKITQHCTQRLKNIMEGRYRATRTHGMIMKQQKKILKDTQGFGAVWYYMVVLSLFLPSSVALYHWKEVLENIVDCNLLEGVNREHWCCFVSEFGKIVITV